MKEYSGSFEVVLPFSDSLIYTKLKMQYYKNYFSWVSRDLKKIFVGYVIMGNENLSQKFHPYSIFTG